MKTLIVYEYPKALPDIYSWAAEQRVLLETLGAPDNASYQVRKFDEEITIIPKEMVDPNHRERPDKLVLWGAFDIVDLQALATLMS